LAPLSRRRRREASRIAIRLALATLVGPALGLDREPRGIPAGIRTQTMLAMSSAPITISALILFRESNGLIDACPDPLPVLQGLAQAIGFVAAGAIFVSEGDVHRPTSADHLRRAAALGIAAGAGQIDLVPIDAGFGILITPMRFAERLLPGSGKARRDQRSERWTPASPDLGRLPTADRRLPAAQPQTAAAQRAGSSSRSVRMP
jgi:putative Mg2+ transporter-C (MgtC) family protein